MKSIQILPPQNGAGFSLASHFWRTGGKFIAPVVAILSFQVMWPGAAPFEKFRSGEATLTEDNSINLKRIRLNFIPIDS